MKKIIIVSIVCFIAIVGIVVVMTSQKAQVTNNTEVIHEEQAYTDLIQVTTPKPKQKVTNPLIVQGKARGSWYFEATFPIEIFDANNILLGKGFATARGEWMTEDFVEFAAEIQFDSPTTSDGTLVIINANPSGLAENEKKVRIPITF